MLNTTFLIVTSSCCRHEIMCVVQIPMCGTGAPLHICMNVKYMYLHLESMYIPIEPASYWAHSGPGHIWHIWAWDYLGPLSPGPIWPTGPEANGAPNLLAPFGPWTLSAHLAHLGPWPIRVHSNPYHELWKPLHACMVTLPVSILLQIQYRHDHKYEYIYICVYEYSEEQEKHVYADHAQWVFTWIPNNNTYVGSMLSLTMCRKPTEEGPSIIFIFFVFSLCKVQQLFTSYRHVK